MKAFDCVSNVGFGDCGCDPDPVNVRIEEGDSVIVENSRICS